MIQVKVWTSTAVNNCYCYHSHEIIENFNNTEYYMVRNCNCNCNHNHDMYVGSELCNRNNFDCLVGSYCYTSAVEIDLMMAMPDYSWNRSSPACCLDRFVRWVDFLL